MQESGHSGSIFSAKLDRVAFIAYFLGAVVPLLALAVVMERYVLPDLADRTASFGLIALMVSIAILSLGSFLTLRRTTRDSLQQIDRDNERLAWLLTVSGSLATAQHDTDAAATAATCAVDLTQASAVFVMTRNRQSAAPTLLQSAGGDAAKLFQSHDKALTDLAKLVMSTGQPAIRGPRKKADGSNIGAAVVVPLPGEPTPIGVVAAVHMEPGREFKPSEVNALSTLAGLASIALRNCDLRDTQRNFFSHVTDILVTALDSHLGYHTGHGNRVAKLANRLGRELGLDEVRMQRLHFSALLHDIGMLKLDREQQMNAKSCAKHTVLGARMLGRILLWEDIAPIVQHHHERFDGKGYPEGLAGEAIPLESRIIALCDTFDTMSSNMSYKEALPVSDCIREIQANAGTQFDPEMVRAFLALVENGTLESVLSS